MINNRNQLFCAFIDFTKASDYIMRSVFTHVKSRVKYMNQLSDSFECLLGVRQGECLSPFLFSIFINDIEDMFIKNGNTGIDMYMFKMFFYIICRRHCHFCKQRC